MITASYENTFHDFWSILNYARLHRAEFNVQKRDITAYLCRISAWSSVHRLHLDSKALTFRRRTQVNNSRTKHPEERPTWFNILRMISLGTEERLWESYYVVLAY